MSVWTHVSGMVRIRTYNDSMKSVKKTINYLHKILGKPTKEGENPLMPNGSEGPLKYHIANVTRTEREQIYDKENDKWLDEYEYIQKPDELIVTVFGDLRDMEIPPSRYNYETTEDLENWFFEFIKALQKGHRYLDIRGAHLIYECEESNTAWFLQAIDGPNFGDPMVVMKQMVPKEGQLRQPLSEKSEFNNKNV